MDAPRNSYFVVAEYRSLVGFDHFWAFDKGEINFRRVILAGTDFGNALVVNIDAVYSYCLSDIPNMGCHELTYTNISKLRLLGN